MTTDPAVTGSLSTLNDRIASSVNSTNGSLTRMSGSLTQFRSDMQSYNLSTATALAGSISTLYAYVDGQPVLKQAGRGTLSALTVTTNASLVQPVITTPVTLFWNLSADFEVPTRAPTRVNGWTPAASCRSPAGLAAVLNSVQGNLTVPYNGVYCICLGVRFSAYAAATENAAWFRPVSGTYGAEIGDNFRLACQGGLGLNSVSLAYTGYFAAGDSVSPVVYTSAEKGNTLLAASLGGSWMSLTLLERV